MLPFAKGTIAAAIEFLRESEKSNLSGPFINRCGSKVSGVELRYSLACAFTQTPTPSSSVCCHGLIIQSHFRVILKQYNASESYLSRPELFHLFPQLGDQMVTCFAVCIKYKVNI